jgi:cell division protein FtsW (lipid II flippase)
MIFLLSWRTIFVMGAIFFGMLSVCMSGGVKEVHDYRYFYTHPEQRQRVMAWCRADARNAATMECKNALHVEAYPNVVR